MSAPWRIANKLKVVEKIVKTTDARMLGPSTAVPRHQCTTSSSECARLRLEHHVACGIRRTWKHEAVGRCKGFGIRFPGTTGR
jgi:hypothetical protein